MDVLVIGSGGREHAIAWKLSKSPKVNKIYIAPGNGGMSSFCECVDISVNDLEKLSDFASQKNIGLTIVGPEDPLVAGIVDHFKEKGLTIFGPSKMAARLEGSKDFCREICERAGVRIAKGRTFTDFNEACDYVEKQPLPIVVKADGLAAGKGVTIAESKNEAIDALNNAMVKKIFGEAGSQVVIEEFLSGYEVSILAICSGEESIVLAPAQDHKRIFEGDKGPNTGGMGTYSPVPAFSEKQFAKIKSSIVNPILDVMIKEGNPFIGVMFIGLMVQNEDDVRVLEINVRFGDPETQVVLPRLNGDFSEILLAAARGHGLESIEFNWDPRQCVCVVAASVGYPGSYEKGKEILGLEENTEQNSTFVFHAGTTNHENKLVTSGGRVLGVSALANTIEGCRDLCHRQIEKIKFEGKYFRKDIGFRATN